MTNSAGPEFVLSGYRNSTSMYNQGTRGYCWSSTAASSATYAYSPRLLSSGAVYPADYNSKNYGFSLRCLALLFRLVFSTHTIYQLLTDSTGPNLVLSGFRRSTSMNYQGTVGLYWSSTAHSSATYAYNLRLYSSGAVYPAYDHLKYDGFSLRCLARTAPIRFASTLPQNVFCQERKKEANFPFTHYPNYTSMTNSAGPEFVLGGSRDGANIDYQGNGIYWSSTAYADNARANLLYLNGNDKTVSSSHYGRKNRGDPLRCLADERKGSGLFPPTTLTIPP